MFIAAVLVAVFVALFSSEVMSAPLRGCTVSACLNGGVCVNGTNGSFCSCALGYRGQYCGTMDVEAVKNEVGMLSTQLKILQILLNMSKFNIDQVFTDTMDTILSSQGPRFFIEWITIEHSEASQLRMFSIGTNRHFIGVATTNQAHALYGITIYEIMPNSSLNAIQTIQVEGIRTFQSFSLNDAHYIAIACSHGNNSTSSSWLYKWSGFQFVQRQEITNNGAADVDFISTSQASFLAFSCDLHDSVPVVYVWDPSNEQFVFYQSIPVMGAVKVHFAMAKDTIYLTVAAVHTAPAVFEFKVSTFKLVDSEINSKARDLYPFSVGSFLFLVALNQFESMRHLNSSVLYRLSGDHFKEHASLPISGDHVHYFPVKGEHFLVVAGEQSGSGSVTDVVVHKLDGASLVPFQRIPAPSASFVDTFLLPDGCRVLLVSSLSGFPKLYKWASVGLKPNSCSQ